MLGDVDRILFHEQTILSRLDDLARQITADYEGKELTVVAILNGSLMFMADLLRRIPLPLKLDCLSVSSYHGGTESSGKVSFDQTSLPDIDGRHVLILDDILDSGRTLHAIVQRLRQACRPTSIRVCVLLAKRKVRAQKAVADYIGFEIGDEFVVGYGLDYGERYRNLPFVGVLKTP
jgi:hypoxanthine phosphoribosyltransferase